MKVVGSGRAFLNRLARLHSLVECQRGVVRYRHGEDTRRDCSLNQMVPTLNVLQEIDALSVRELLAQAEDLIRASDQDGV